MTEEDPDLLAGNNLDRLRGRPMTDSEIVARLRLYAKRMDETRSTVLGLLLADTADEIERLRKEREEAEPLLNELWERRTEATEMQEEINRLRAERDEARRRLCLEWTEHGPVRLSQEQIAMRYGWDCFEEEMR